MSNVKLTRSNMMNTLSWAAVLVVAAFIFWMSAKDGTTLDEGSGIISLVKAWLASAAQTLFGHQVDVSPVGHFCEFFVFGITLVNALRWHMPLPRAFVSALVIGCIYGATDEFHQIFVPLRTCDPADWLVDTVAAGLGAALTVSLYARVPAQGFAQKDRQQ